MKEPTPTPEDRERVRRQIEHAREHMEEILVRLEARRAPTASAATGGGSVMRRILPFRRGA